jgi:hypothetical protein
MITAPKQNGKRICSPSLLRGFTVPTPRVCQGYLVAAFGKRLGEIIPKAMGSARDRDKFRKGGLLDHLAGAEEHDRRDREGREDGAHCLGVVGQGRHLSGAPARGSVL